MAKSRSRSSKRVTSPTTVVTFLLMKAAASLSSFSRRPVITTCAPSSTKRLAVAKPIPLLPPVITAIFPANLCPWLLLILLLLLEQILEDEPTPSAAACVHQRAALVELSQLDGCE